jgi:thioredoxin reductase
MDLDMIESVQENFASAALRLKRAGFDMCLLHGAHGWLLAQFLSPFSNQRTDRYGGSLENRARFPLEVIERVRDRVGSDFAIEYRLSGGEQVPGGLSLEDAVRFARMIKDKVDCIHVSTGLFGEPQTLPIIHPTNYLPHGSNVHLAAKIKAAVKIPVTCVGSISDPRMAEEIIADGKADLVAMTRALIADPDLPNKARRGKFREIRPCTRCLECLGRVATFLPVRRAVNPISGRETECAAPRPADRSKKILIAGGGPGGMQAAITAARRGHRVVLFEKKARLGGNLGFADAVDFKQDLRRFREYLMETVRALPVDIRLGTQLTPSLAEVEMPDVVIVAAGAEPSIPDIPGISSDNVLWAGEVHADKVRTGQHIVVAGGGMVGCETALLLAREGKAVTVVEMLEAVATDLNPVTRIHLLELLEKAGVRIFLNHRLERITRTGAGVVNADGEAIKIPAETVVLSLGMRPRKDVVTALAHCAPEVYAIGDCVRPGKASGAIHDGFNVAMEL